MQKKSHKASNLDEGEFHDESEHTNEEEVNEIADLYHNQEQLYKRFIGIEIMPKKNTLEISNLNQRMDALTEKYNENI
jgi:hypothetical protein